MEDNYNSNFDTKPAPKTPSAEKNNLAIASMIVGILSFPAFCCFPTGLALSVAGIVLVILSKRNGKPWSGFSVTGLVLSVQTLTFNILLGLYVIVFFSMLKDPSYSSWFNDLMNSVPLQ